jgi:metal-sulfur cluster biosynthetic enzyme
LSSDVRGTPLCHSERSEESGAAVRANYAEGKPDSSQILRCAQDDKRRSAQDDKREAVVARIWGALKQVDDPEIPVSLVDMGLIVAVEYEPASRTARLRITYTAMGCPAMDMIQDDISERLLREPDIAAVDVKVVWDPTWSRQRLSQAARATMRELGIAV